MKFGWENEEKKIKRYIALPAKKKLEWLHDINEFVFKTTLSGRKNKKRSRAVSSVG